MRGCCQSIGVDTPIPAAGEGLFPHLPTEACVGALRSDGIWTGLRLPPRELAEIRQFATDAPCTRPDGGQPFRIGEVAQGHAPDGRPLAIADIRAPLDCPAVARIARDPSLLAAVTRYLRFRPGRMRLRLFWSVRAELPDEVRRALGQTIDFHYDIEACNALYVYFYLTPTTRETGAHVMVRGSHRRKPLRMMLSRCFQPAGAVLACYGAENVLTVEGPAGFGFLEAPECFHLALAPARADRLVLQLRYS